MRYFVLNIGRSSYNVYRKITATEKYFIIGSSKLSDTIGEKTCTNNARF